MSAAQFQAMQRVLKRIELERLRQVRSEGYTLEHDDTRPDKRPHEGNEVRSNGARGELYRRRLLEQAAALIVAEIERIDRAPG